ncbi:MAG: hypothetical protein ACP6IS_08165 [Candidatus Asgardarchaeia archaeon]
MSHTKFPRLPKTLRLLFKDFEENLERTFEKISGHYPINVDFLRTYLFYYLNENFIKAIFKSPISEDFGPILILLSLGDKTLLFNVLTDFSQFAKTHFNLENAPFWVIDFEQLLDIESDRIHTVKSISELLEDTTIDITRSIILASSMHQLFSKVEMKDVMKLPTPEMLQIENALLKLKGLLTENAIREATKLVLGQPCYVIINHVLMALVS